MPTKSAAPTRQGQPTRNGSPTRNGASHADGRRADGRRAHVGPTTGRSGATEIQPFGRVNEAFIALPRDARTESCELVNEILADTMVLYALYKKHHWLVAGPTFYQLHLLFDKHAEEQAELIDLLGERVQGLGGIAVGDPRHAAELTTIERPPNGAEDVVSMLRRLVGAHETIVTKVRHAITATEEAEDWGTNDLLMGDVLRRHELQTWFVSMHLVDEPIASR